MRRISKLSRSACLARNRVLNCSFTQRIHLRGNQLMARSSGPVQVLVKTFVQRQRLSSRVRTKPITNFLRSFSILPRGRDKFTLLCCTGCAGGGSEGRLRERGDGSEVGVSGGCSPAMRTERWLLAGANDGATGGAAGVIAETTGSSGTASGNTRSGDLQIGHTCMSAE